jgi:hypothetical protein
LADNFPPEVNAPASRTYEHCREWVKAGHKVTVITCAPNFPRGKVFDNYKNKLWQHENVDGSGYPKGLKGSEIPLFGRIVSVADAFDAMTTDRPYSKAMTFEASVARLKFLAGKKFDGSCVEAFERAFLAGDVSPEKARRASVASRHFDLNALFGEMPQPAATAAGAAASPPAPV